MKKLVLLILLTGIYSCTSKVKEGSHITVYNETAEDVFMIDRSSFNNASVNKPLQIIDYGQIDPLVTPGTPQLRSEFITMYTTKSIFFPLMDYEHNKGDVALVFYFIRRRYLNRTKTDILKYRLYDSIRIDFNEFHEKGSDNHIYYKRNGIQFVSY